MISSRKWGISFAPAGEVQSGVTLLGVGLLLISALSFSRGLQRLYELSYRLPALGMRNTPRGVVQHARELLEEAHANVVGAILTLVEARVHLRSGYADAEVYHPRYGGYFRE